MAPVASIHAKAIELGKLSVRMTAKAGSGHPSTALSLTHLVTELMYRRMRHDPANPFDRGADRLVLSEGHAVPIVYAAYADLGGAVGTKPDNLVRLTKTDVDGLRDVNSVLDGHPNPAEGVPFFDAATGSLGQGLSVAAGMALGARLDGSPRVIYVIIGDGESREGQIWEAADFVVDHGLSNVCAIFNCNGQGQTGLVSEQQSADRLAEKLTAFGWTVKRVDGHDPAQVAEALEQPSRSPRPVAVVARTVKGWGVDPLLHGNWHGKPLPESQVAVADASLDKAAATLGAAGAAALKGPTAPESFIPAVARPKPTEVVWPAFADAMKAGGFGAALEKNSLSTRRAYGATLRAAGGVLPQVVCVDADVSNSTFTELFGKAHPNRFFECKIAEQNMISVAAGLSAAGFIPFANTFAKFFARAYDQIEMAHISRANIKLVGSHAGISLAADGPSQMSLVDVAYFRSFGTVRGDDRSSPLCWFFQPSDAVSAFHLTRLMTQINGLCYMRTHRPEVPLLYAPETAFEPGGFHALSSGDEMALVSSGFMVHVCREAAAALAKQGRRVALIDLYSLPLNGAKLLDVLSKSGRRALVVEDNYGGGVGSAVADLAAGAGGVVVQQLHCQRLPKSARTEREILDYCGVSAEQIADHALALLRRPA